MKWLLAASKLVGVGYGSCGVNGFFFMKTQEGSAAGLDIFLDEITRTSMAWMPALATRGVNQLFDQHPVFDVPPNEWMKHERSNPWRFVPFRFGQSVSAKVTIHHHLTNFSWGTHVAILVPSLSFVVL